MMMRAVLSVGQGPVAIVKTGIIVCEGSFFRFQGCETASNQSPAVSANVRFRTSPAENDFTLFYCFLYIGAVEDGLYRKQRNRVRVRIPA